VSDTPKTLQEECYGTCWAACERIEELESQLRAASNRIKRLEEAGDKMDETADPFVLYAIEENIDEGPIPMSEVSEQYEITYDNPPTAGDHVAIERARKEWRKAKEAKL
jgi:hypothetical protein